MHAQRARMLADLVDLIADTVGDPDEWLDEHSVIQELNGNLIIRTRLSNHGEIEALLNKLREGRRGIMQRFVREVEVARLLHQAELARAEGDHAGALVLVEQALAVDPLFEPARAMRLVLEETIARQEAAAE